MGRQYAQYDGRWAVFSTIADGFITPLMSLEELEAWRKEEYGATRQPFEHTGRISFADAIAAWLNADGSPEKIQAWLKENNILATVVLECVISQDEHWHTGIGLRWT